MHENNMAEAIDTFLHKVTTDPAASQVNINGVLVTGKNGLILASQDVTHDCSGPITVLSDLASTLLDRSSIVCLENGDRKVIIRDATKTVFSVYTGTTSRQ